MGQREKKYKEERERGQVKREGDRERGNKQLVEKDEAATVIIDCFCKCEAFHRCIR